jgi:long-chain fatty acid transport protein
MMTKFRNNLLYLSVTPLIAVGASTAVAGGLYAGEFGQPNQGASRAGAAALAEDASTAAQNPAGIMFLDGKKSMQTGLVVNAEIEFDGDAAASSLPPSVANLDGSRPASNGGDAGGTSIGGAFFHARPVNEKWGWGFSLTSVSAAVLDHEDKQDFAGRYWATKADILTINLMPSLSYKLTDD